MAWYRNHYTCDRCKKDWEDEWSCMCDDDCPHCGARHMSPDNSDDLTKMMVFNGTEYVLFESPQSAADSPDYSEVGRSKSGKQALAFLKA